MTKIVVVLGGYGNFGSRIVAALANELDTRVYIAGRDMPKATALAREIGGNVEAIAIDQQSDDFAARLRALGATVLVHTAGPFQGQDYRIARACIAAGCHYVDIADGRSYVARIGELDGLARANNVLAVSGASSLPALSSAVIDQYRKQFTRLDVIDHAISSGAKPPGIATMRGVMSYVGKPFTRWERDQWRTVYGWQDVIARRFPSPVGDRWLANCDVPDLELFPQRYSGVRSVTFRAGLGFGSTTLTTWLLSWLVRMGAIATLARYADVLHRAAVSLERYGTQWSAMRVQLDGVDEEQRPLRKTWLLLAGDNHGPYIPCCPAIALTRKLLCDDVRVRGAMPCIGLLTVDEILGALPHLNLRIIEEG